MDIGALSIGMQQYSLATAVSTSLLKIAMNNGSEIATQMTDMMSNMAVDTSRGTTIDARA